MEEVNISRKMVAELLGTMGLVIAVMGSVMLANNFAGGFGVPGFLLAGLAGGFVLFAMIESLGKISGGHFNPAITIAMIVSKDISAKNGVFYIIAQILGGLVAAVLMLVTFYSGSGDIFVGILDQTPDSLAYLAISEFLCVFMLVTVVFCCVRSGSKKTSMAVGATVGGMIMCTASTFYANPAIDIARVFSNASDRISLVTSAVFIVMAVLAAIVAALVLSWLYPKETAV
jgi:glycerol uptake facilitator-like aquaporin